MAKADDTAASATPDPAIAASSSSTSSSLAKGEINYNFVTGMYAIASLIFVVLIVLDKVVVVPQVEGFWIIFAPFIPCLLVSLPLRSRWLKRRTEEVAQKKDK
jgi:hypothetical protein